jgi:protein phosphatase
VTLALPVDAMVVLIGTSGAGKSTFAARHFAPTEILSSDAMRAVVADDAGDQTATDAAFDLLHTALGLRLARRRLTVVDATNVDAWARERLLAAARRHRRPAAAIAFNLPLELCLERNRLRGDRPLPKAVIRRQHAHLRGSLKVLDREGFGAVWVLSSVTEVDAARLERGPG